MALPEFTDRAACYEVLRLANGDIDETRIDAAVAAANRLIFAALAKPSDDPQYTAPTEEDPATDEYLLAWPVISEAARIVALDLYRRPTAPFGILDSFSDLGPVRVGRDPIGAVWHLLGPFANHAAQIGL